MTSSNFSFLQTEWPALHVEALKSEQARVSRPAHRLLHARRTLELAVVWLFQAEGDEAEP